MGGAVEGGVFAAVEAAGEQLDELAEKDDAFGDRVLVRVGGEVEWVE